LSRTEEAGSRRRKERVLSRNEHVGAHFMDAHWKLIIFDEKAGIVSFVMRKWQEICAESLNKRGCMTVALSGGNTPVDIYKALALSEFSWKDIQVFQVDERFVPRDGSDSNYRMIRETLLDAVSIPQQNIHFVDTGKPSADDAAKAYEQELVRFFRLQPGQFPRFDIIMLGLGEDGHTASLFPRSPLLDDVDHLVRAVILDSGLHDRITLTLQVINRARHIIFLIMGAHKALALKKIVEEKDVTLPAAMINPAGGELLFLSDREAVGLLAEDTCERGGT
jgi:6-phosphogluconolactonase